jgi:hypothetical protein
MMHIEHTQIKILKERGSANIGFAWCGKKPKGARLAGFDNFLYYEGPGPVCPDCIKAIVASTRINLARMKDGK